jgi:hypothetical protein
MHSRYLALPDNPPSVLDTWKDRTVATFITFEQAVSRAYVLNMANPQQIPLR